MIEDKAEAILCEHYFNQAMTALREQLDAAATEHAPGRDSSLNGAVHSYSDGRCECHGMGLTDKIELPLISGTPYNMGGHDYGDAEEARANIRARALTGRLSRHEVAFAGLDPGFAWSPLSEEIPPEGG